MTDPRHREPDARPRPRARRPEPAPYPALLRTTRSAWWRPVVGLLLLAGLVVVVSGAVGVVALLLGSALYPRADDALRPDTVLGLLTTNVLLALLTPLALLVAWAVHRVHPLDVVSVVRGVRWRLLAGLAGVAVALYIAGLGVSVLLPADEAVATGGRPGTATTLGLLAVMLLTTPLQSAGEELAFRGYLSQAVASWFRVAAVGAVVAAVLSAVLFALAHGGQEPLLFADRLAFGLTASWLAWRTGGLEASIALHAVNNVFALTAAILTGTLSQSLAATSLTWPYLVLDVTSMLAFVAAVEVVARVRRLQRISPADVVVPPPGAPLAAPLGAPPPVRYPAPRPDGRWGMG